MIKNSVFSFESDVRYVVNYLPTKRCRKTRSVDMYACHKFYVKNISSGEAAGLTVMLSALSKRK